MFCSIIIKKIDACLCAVYEETSDEPYDKISKIFENEKEISINKKTFLKREFFSRNDNEQIEQLISEEIKRYLTSFCIDHTKYPSGPSGT